jgi:hypothetical protein
MDPHLTPYYLPMKFGKILFYEIRFFGLKLSFSRTKVPFKFSVPENELLGNFCTPSISFTTPPPSLCAGYTHSLCFPPIRFTPVCRLARKCNRCNERRLLTLLSVLANATRDARSYCNNGSRCNERRSMLFRAPALSNGYWVNDTECSGIIINPPPLNFPSPNPFSEGNILDC